MTNVFLRMPRRPALAAAALLTGGLLAACASAPRTNLALDDARTSYQRAVSDPQLARSAELQLRKAQQALQQGESALRSDDDTAAVDHYAYLARRHVEAAQQVAQVAAAEQAAKNAAQQRDSIVIASRTQEAQAQRAKAEAERAQAEAARRQAAGANTRARELEQQLADLKAKQTDRGMVLTLGDVLFDTGRAQLKPGAMRTLDQLATFLRDNPERTVQIEGYTDSTGSSAVNQTLSQDRAESVKNALMDRGIAINRIAARGFGTANPVASNSTAAGRQRNRRVEVVISNQS